MNDDMPTIGPRSSQPPAPKVTPAQSLRALGFVIVLVTVGIPLTILLWKVALSWSP